MSEHSWVDEGGEELKWSTSSLMSLNGQIYDKKKNWQKNTK